MLYLFSFKKPLIRHLLEHCMDLYPGINQAVGIYYNPSISTIQACEYLSNKDVIIETAIDKYNIDIRKERRASKLVSWISPDELINKETTQSYHQLELGDEAKHTVLLVRIPNNDDFQMDLLYIFFNSNTGIFGLEKELTELTPREKSLIARMTINFINFQQKQQREDKTAFIDYNDSANTNIEKLKRIQKKLKDTQENYKQSILEYCSHKLMLISRETYINFQFTNQALEYLPTFQGPFELLDQTIRKAAQNAVNKSIDPGRGVFMIEDTDITFPDFEEKAAIQETKEETIPIVDLFARTREILDRYERAAQIAKDKDLPITGKVIGSLCVPAISHPAITDSLDKHHQKILILFEENPNKWPIIRREFRSVRNLMNRKPRNYRKTDDNFEG